MTASGFGAVDKLAKAGDTATGTITFAGSPPIVVPSATAGQVLTSDASGNMTPQSSLGWFNVRTYGAKGDNVTDDTAAIQAAINACASNKGGVVYFPHGVYVTSSSLTYAGGGTYGFAPMRFLGDNKQAAGFNPGGSVILWKPGAGSYNVFDFGSSGVIQGIYMEGLNIQNYSNPSVNQGHIVVNIQSTVSEAHIVDCSIYSMFTNQATTGIKTAGAGTRIEACQISAYAQAVWMNGGQICDITNRCTLSTTAGSGFGAVYQSASAQSLSITNSQSQGGDRGLYVASGGFTSIANYSVNIPAVAGVELVTGSQFWAEQMWLSHSGGPTGSPVHGLVVGSGYTGFVYVSQGTFQQWPGYGAWIKGGSGYNFTNCTFGISGQASANTYDGLHIANTVSNVTVGDCHFDVDPFMGLGSPVARSAIYIESGATNVQINNCAFANGGYGTAAIIDLNATPGFYASNLYGPNSQISVDASASLKFQNFAFYTGTTGNIHPLSTIPKGSAIVVQVETSTAGGTVAVSDGSNTYVQAGAGAVSGGATQYVFVAVNTGTQLTTASTITVTSSVSQTVFFAAYSVPNVPYAGCIVNTGTGTSPTASGNLISPYSMQIGFFFNNNSTALSVAPGANWTFQGTNATGTLENQVYSIFSANSASSSIAAAYAGSQSWAVVLLSLAVSAPPQVQASAVNTVAGNIAALGTQAAGTVGLLADAGHVHPTTGLFVPGTVAATTAGFSTSGSAPVLTPTFASGTAAQLTDTTRDYMVYLQVGTAGTAMSVAIGPTSSPANTILSSAVATAGELMSFRVPAGWWTKWTATTATLASQKAVGC